MHLCLNVGMKGYVDRGNGGRMPKGGVPESFSSFQIPVLTGMRHSEIRTGIMAIYNIHKLLGGTTQ